MSVKAVVLIMMLLFISTVNSFSSNYRFQNISIQQGLSNLNINSLCEDNQGYIWIGTQRGLNRYNGYEFQHFYFDRSDSLGLTSNRISSLYCSSNNKLFVGTNNGLSCYDLQKQCFTNQFPQLKQTNIRDIIEWNGVIYVATNLGLFCLSQSNNTIQIIYDKMSINVFYVDRESQLWCGGNKGIIKVESNGKVRPFCIEQSLEFKGHAILSISQGSSSKELWLGTSNGILIFDKANLDLVKSKEDKYLNSKLYNYQIEFIIEKDADVFWIGTNKSGLYEYNATNKELIILKDSDNTRGLKSGNFSSALIDNCGNTWIGTFDNGLEVHFKYLKKFNPNAALNRLTKDKFITCIAPLGDDQLLVSTRGDGFFVFNRSSGESQHLTVENSDLESNYIKNISEDRNGQVWVASLSGVQIFNIKKGTFTKLSSSVKIGYSTICFDKNKVYMGIPGLGLVVYSDSGKLLLESKDWGTNITKILPLNEDELLLSCYGVGVYVFNKNKNTARLVHEKFSDIDGLNRIVTSYFDHKGLLWLGSYGWGMYKIDLVKETITNFNKKSGLPSNDVIGIVEDQYNHLWLSTSYGLARFDKDSESIKNYFINEGVNNTQFHEKSAYRDEDGMIYFGGNFGLTYFYPEQLMIPDVVPPHLVVEELRVLNEIVEPTSDNTILNQAISFSSDITLSHKQKEFSLKLTAIDFLSPGQVKYAYKLDGLEDKWNDIGIRRLVSFAYLKPGTYTFQFKAKSTDSDWSEPSKPLKIQIKAAPWFSWWAMSLYTLLLALMVWGTFRFLFRLKIYRHKLQLEQYEHQRENEIHEMKLRFFTNISHEFRTPLTIISMLTKQLVQGNKKQLEKGQILKSLDLNINRLLKLVNQILVFREMENDTLQLKVQKIGMAALLAELVKPFEYYASQKDIHLDCAQVIDCELFVDRDKVDKILSNIISNAIKFSPNGGRIYINTTQLQPDEVNNKYDIQHLRSNDSYYEISVSDCGPGILEANLKKVFQRYKKYNSNLADYSGTGIGLDFCKKLIELHNGFITANNGSDKGAIFSFVIPMNSEVYKAGEFSDVENPSKLKFQERKNISVNDIQIRKNRTVLVVEDDAELNQLISESLSEYFTVESSFDGAEAFELVESKRVDLIVSDVMMPNVDGMEFCEKIKRSDKWAHIPFILLSAKTDVDTQISGLNVGADVYVTKPFDISYMVALVDSQLRNREKIHRIFMNGAMPKFEKDELNQRDIEFLKKVNNLIEENFRKTEFNIADLAALMNMSRSTFYRKFIGLTNVTPNDYIKKFRINKAVELLKVNNYSMAETSELAGFATQGYFSTIFKNEMGITPSAFVKQNVSN